MLKKFTTRLVLGVALMGAVSGAQALAIWDDLYDPTDFKLSEGNSSSYQHDIRDDGFLPGVDSILGASLTIWLYDDERSDSSEEVKFNFDSKGWTNSIEVNGTKSSSWEYLLSGLTFPISTGLLSDGLLNVVLKSIEGDFKFDKSYLLAWGNDKGGSVSVPEPGTLTLFGLGLLGVGLVRRRRKAI